MSYSLLDAVNATLKRVKIISGATGELSSLTDSARQTYIDVAVQIVNESIQELYSTAELPMPTGSDIDTVTLATDTREYSLPADLEKIRFPLVDHTNGTFIMEYEGGYELMRAAQLQPDNWKGLPYFATINPATGLLRMDRVPTSSENGRAYELFYDKRLSLAAATDTFPFSDTVVDALVPVWSELWKREQRNSFDEKLAALHYARASRYLTKKPLRQKW